MVPCETAAVFAHVHHRCLSLCRAGHGGGLHLNWTKQMMRTIVTADGAQIYCKKYRAKQLKVYHH